jgi:hypothetical protein
MVIVTSSLRGYWRLAAAWAWWVAAAAGLWKAEAAIRLAMAAKLLMG